MELDFIKDAINITEKFSDGIKIMPKPSSYNDIHSAESIKGVQSSKRQYLGGKVKQANLDMSYDQLRKSPHPISKRSEVMVRETFQLPPLISDFSYCTKCKRTKPPRTHHCRKCDRCILRMDHHCPWLGNCIGFNNHKYFFLMLVYYNLFLSYTLWCILKVLLNVRNVEIHHFMYLIYVIISIPVFLFLLVLLIFHSYLITHNITTLEANRNEPQVFLLQEFILKIESI